MKHIIKIFCPHYLLFLLSCFWTYCTFAQRSVVINTDFSGVTLKKNMTRIVGIDTLNLTINYEGKDRTKAWAEVCDAPNRKDKKALHFQFKSPNVLTDRGEEIKGRIQNELKFIPGFKNIVNEVDIFFPMHMSYLKSYPEAIHFLTLQEYWNDAYNRQFDKVFRMTVGMNKDKGVGKDLYLELRCADRKQDAFHYTLKSWLKSWNIPFGKWFTLRTEIEEGNVENGRFKLMVKMLGDSDWIVIFDGVLQTQSSEYNDGILKPDGINSFQVFKFYTSKDIINYMKDKGLTMDVYYSNWRFKGTREGVYSFKSTN